MSQIINRKKDMISQTLNGVAFIHQETLQRVPKTGIIKRKNIAESKNKVALISGGGSGHEPAHFGYVGKGMLSASVSGPIFVPPSADEILQAIQSVGQEAGVLLIIKNFEADVSVFLEAKAAAHALGIAVEHVLVNDDCSIEEGSFKKRRRGVAGTVLVHKILGAAAEEGATLQELVHLGQRVVESMNTLGVALNPGNMIADERQLFELGDGEISFGIGIHGEAGYRTETFYSSEYLANELVNKLLVQYEIPEGKDFAILINGLGSTTLMEQFIFANDIQRLLTLASIKVVFQKAGNFMTSTNMAGVSLTFLELKEKKWLDYLSAPTEAFAWQQ
ncbi:DhaKLM operon coactivator DhaQ [Vagococcus elongatus]|uniref:DhaKLM operon coactivator DhaQ n=1 Tax=Vagococcus elongatus TaxID=180344 RepID=A0A430B1R8_9ENTE|nr:DhaKLM operon coactivator DhaQ [Vagococcus elongatus]RSU14274.1 DhaKLM operon coactivator DhaQ [Vagococcus elongatus]